MNVASTDSAVDSAIRDISPGEVNVALVTASATLPITRPPLPRTSEVLRGVLANNPGVQRFSVERILSAIGVDRAEVSLLMFSLPGIVPVPVSKKLVALPAGALARQLASGQKQLQIPRFVLKKVISRRALAVALHSVLPVIEAAEKVVRPRWNWINHSAARRAIGVFIFLLAVAIAFPLFGFTTLHATSIFVMAFGMAEQDGLAVLLGVAVGVVSLAILAASGMSARALRAKGARWLRKLGQKLGLDMLARFLHRRGYERLARLLTREWSSLLLLWDPERRRPPASRGEPARAVPPAAADAPRAAGAHQPARSRRPIAAGPARAAAARTARPAGEPTESRA